MNSSRNKKYAFFDVCGTLTKNNNTEDFVRWVARDDLPKDRDDLIGCLNGIDDAKLEKAAKDYVGHLVEKGLFNTELLKKVKRYKENGYCVYLLSASIHYPIKAIAAHLGTKWSASMVKVEKGRSLGKLEYDLLDKKEMALDKIKDVDYKKSVFYTDNPGDKALFKRFPCGNTFFVDNEIFSEVDSVNKKNYLWVYFPGFYYLISRLHFDGFVNILLLRELVPIIVITVIENFEIWKVFLGFGMFYMVYEIGSLWNDTHYKNEEIPTRRIAAGVKINWGLFLSIRAFIFLLCWWWKVISTRLVLLLVICLFVSYVHTSISRRHRTITILLLRLFRTFLPIYFLLDRSIVQNMGIIVFTAYHLPSVIYYRHFRSNSLSRRKLLAIELLIIFFVLIATFLLDRRLVVLGLYLGTIRAAEVINVRFFGKR